MTQRRYAETTYLPVAGLGLPGSLEEITPFYLREGIELLGLGWFQPQFILLTPPVKSQKLPCGKLKLNPQHIFQMVQCILFCLINKNYFLVLALNFAFIPLLCLESHNFLLELL